ncbi:MAG: efflux transporter periplasmic adaptor subunit, partial [Variovorax sp.]
MSEQRHAGLAIHPIDLDEEGEHHALLRRRQIVHRTRISVLIVVVLLAIGAARTVFVRIANARELEAGTAERATQ